MAHQYSDTGALSQEEKEDDKHEEAFSNTGPSIERVAAPQGVAFTTTKSCRRG